MIKCSSDGTEYEVFCDRCSFSQVFKYNGDWEEFLYQASQAGWKFWKVDDNWEHICEDCFI